MFERTGAAAKRVAAPRLETLGLKLNLKQLSLGWRAMKARHAFMVILVCAGLSPAVAAEAPPGAASCTGCHAEKQNVNSPVPRLAGQDASAMITAMQAYRGGQRPATVMDRIAKGFSDDEIASIASWLVMQR